MNRFVEINRHLWLSFRRLPLWVQVWMALVLVPVNLLSFLVLEYQAAQMVALAAVLALGSNMLLLYRYEGFSRAMALPHLVFWGPLQILLVMRVLQTPAPDAGEVMFIGLVLLVNGISLIFDLLDTWRWWQGERQVF
ncbi:hypothetical protein IPC369_08915 [Pseudomonas aeruginosa]|uniref:hypothetical protein n=1 Tax=Pseudomonas aeruginosa TaxID=287 RepID=UPI000F874596|nr:hypothetical protein [Pseudomonas aeruginosa]RUJ24904.1 hypothetical protein IPC380_06945 [Pseudomonas aeruginosa]RUJ42942.1 hypothetical protein IPC369_08915 [Pseudomonas aeruginosa]